MNQISVLKPSMLLFQVLGLNVYKVKNNRAQESNKLKIYSAFQTILLLLLFIRGLFDGNMNINGRKSSVGNTVDFVQLFGIRIAHLLILLESLAQHKKLIRFINNLCETDQIMKKRLDVEFRFAAEQRIYLWNFVSAVIFYISAEGVVLCTFLLRMELELVTYWVSYLFPYLVCCLRYYQTINCVSFIRKRYEILNRKMEELNHRPNSGNSINHKPQKTSSKLIAAIGLIDENHLKFNGTISSKSSKYKDPTFEKLVVFRKLYDNLYELSNLVNHVFGLSLLINIANDFVGTTSNCYFIFLFMQNKPIESFNFLRLIGSIFWSIPHIVNVVLIAGYCHRTVQISHRTALIVHKFEFDVKNDSQSLFIQQFSLQLLHQKLVFTAFGFFNVDYTLLFTILGSTTTFLIILIQFHMTETNSSFYSNSTII